MPQYSITVITKTGKMVGTSWFDKAPQARKYMKRKLKNLGEEPKTIYMFVWREGDTLKTVKKRKLKKL